jgi:4a-hydroxytetrahydrobiopterin dehydratase
MTSATNLRSRTCRHLKDGLGEEEIVQHLAAVQDWQRQGGRIAKTFRFSNYYETLAFVNAIAFLIHEQDHHPELHITYNRCTVMFDTHSVNDGRGGISENDFICAAKIDALLDGKASAR